MFSLETIDVEKKLRVSLTLFSYLANNQYDYIKSYGIFVLTILNSNSNINISELKEKLKSEFELVVPIAPLGEILYSLLKEELVVMNSSIANDGTKNDCYSLTELGRKEIEKCRKLDDVKRDLEPLYKDVRAFLDTKEDKIRKDKVRSTPFHTRRIILRFIDRNISPLLYYTHSRNEDQTLRSEIDEFFKKAKRKTDSHLCEYTRKVKDENSPYYQMMQELIEGTLFSYYYNVDKKYIEFQKQMEKPDVYLDTNLLIFMLGYQFKQFTEPAKELLEILTEWGFKIKIFDSTLLELRSVLRRCTRKDPDSPVNNQVNDVCAYFRSAGITRAEIIDYLSNLEGIIESYGIKIVNSDIDLSKYNKNYIDTLRKDFFEIRKDKEKKKSIANIDHDIAAYLKIKQIRGSEHIENFEDSKAIFLTAHQGLANYNLKSHFNEHTIPEIYLDRFLMELLWAKDPKSHISVESLIATCSRDIFIDPKIWNYFLDKVFEIYGDKKIIERKLNNILILELNERLSKVNPGEFSKVDSIIDEYSAQFGEAIEDEYDNEEAADLEEFTNIHQKDISPATEEPKESEQAPSEKKRDLITILHLSDLHIADNSQITLFKSQLSLDLPKIGANNINYIIISGDIADTASKKEYEAAYNLLDFFIKKFNIKKDHIIIVPGNHDVNYDCSVKAYEAIPKYKCKDRSSRREYISAGPLMLKLKDKDIHKKRFAIFNENFYRPICGEDYPLEYEKQALINEQKEDGIIFLSLNSCWQIDAYNETLSGVNIDSVANSIINWDENNFADYLKIAISHHPIIGDEAMKDDFIELLENVGFQIFIHGHIHDSIDNFHRYDNNYWMRIIGGGTFGKPSNMKKKNIPMQYNFIIIDKNEANIRVWTRQKLKHDGPWSAYPKWGDKVKKPDPYYDIPLSSLSKKS